MVKSLTALYQGLKSAKYCCSGSFVPAIKCQATCWANILAQSLIKLSSSVFGAKTELLRKLQWTKLTFQTVIKQASGSIMQSLERVSSIQRSTSSSLETTSKNGKDALDVLPLSLCASQSESIVRITGAKYSGLSQTAKRVKQKASLHCCLAKPMPPEIELTDRTLFVDGYDSNGERIYDRLNGLTCHQCRQKTIGLRTKCACCDSLKVSQTLFQKL